MPGPLFPPQDRLATLEAVREAGISVCAGGIIGLGEGEKDRIGLLLQVRRTITALKNACRPKHSWAILSLQAAKIRAAAPLTHALSLICPTACDAAGAPRECPHQPPGGGQGHAAAGPGVALRPRPRALRRDGAHCHAAHRGAAERGAAGPHRVGPGGWLLLTARHACSTCECTCCCSLRSPVVFAQVTHAN